jgi:acyl-CoA synthetase (AMP-forming)/AMP-acid ligase II
MAAEGAAERQTIPALLAQRAGHDGDKPALIQDDRAITYRELDDASRARAGQLVAAGVNKRSRVGLLMPNGIDWVTTAYAVLRIGAVLVPLSTLLRPPELAHQLRGSSVSHLVLVGHHRNRDYLADLASIGLRRFEPGTSGARDAALPALQRVWVADELPGAAAPAELVDALGETVRPADDLAILFTSGSRGAPKGVVHTHGNAIRAVAAGLQARGVRRGDRLYLPMPFFWMGGFGTGVLSALVAGATLLTECDPEPARTLAFLERHRVTLFRGWPDQAVKLAAHPAFATTDLSSLRPGSLDAVLPPERRARPGARANLFGMTETFGPWCGSPLDTDLPPSAFGSCGRPLDGIECRIVDPDSKQEVPPGTQGEIEVRGPNLMRTIEGRLPETVFTPEGYYRTGDLGRLDAQGYLFYAGRVDDMFKVSGATVYPTEVESALRAIPAVAQAYVTDVDAGHGPVVGAAVVLRDEATIEDLAHAARERLSAFKVPRHWVVLGSPSDVPVMATGKVDKPRLQELIRTAQEDS